MYIKQKWMLYLINILKILYLKNNVKKMSRQTNKPHSERQYLENLILTGDIIHLG